MSIKITNNRDSGSVPVTSADLPKEFQGNGMKPNGLAVRVDGETKTRPVTYIMGSEAKGWHLCCKGSGPFLTGAGTEFSIELVTE